MSHCIFCDIVSGKQPCIKIFEDDTVLAFMDIYPLRRGHTLVIPKHHQQQAHMLNAEIRAHLFNTATKIAQALYASSLSPAAVHYMINDGPAAQQTVPHVHLHILPRYRGDGLNFIGSLMRKPFDILLGPRAEKSLLDNAEVIKKSLAHLMPA